MKRFENYDRDNLVMWDTRETRGHMRKFSKSSLRRDIKKKRAFHTGVETWNKLDKEVIRAETLHAFKTKLDRHGYGEGTV